jgi:hypothetical protein
MKQLAKLPILPAADDGAPQSNSTQKPGQGADSITLDFLEALEDLLANSCQTIRRVRLRSLAGDLGPQDAAVIVRETAETINQFCKP